MLATGALTGVVADCGDGVTYTVPIYDGYAVPHAARREKLGGRDITAFLAASITALPERAANDIKEQLCYVAQDYSAELKRFEDGGSCGSDRTFLLPDGTNIAVNAAERIRCAEALFQPGIVFPDCDSGGLHDMVFGSIAKCDVDVKCKVASNVVLVGGTMQFEGLPSRLRRELAKLLPCLPPAVTLLDDPVNAAFLGGSIAAKTSSIRWLTRAEYEESGQDVVRWKFPSLLEAGQRAGTK